MRVDVAEEIAAQLAPDDLLRGTLPGADAPAKTAATLRRVLAHLPEPEKFHVVQGKARLLGPGELLHATATIGVPSANTPFADIDLRFAWRALGGPWRVDWHLTHLGHPRFGSGFATEWKIRAAEESIFSLDGKFFLGGEGDLPYYVEPSEEFAREVAAAVGWPISSPQSGDLL